MRTKIEKWVEKVETSTIMEYCIKGLGMIVIASVILGVYFYITRGFNF